MFYEQFELIFIIKERLLVTFVYVTICMTHYYDDCHKSLIPQDLHCNW